MALAGVLVPLCDACAVVVVTGSRVAPRAGEPDVTAGRVHVTYANGRVPRAPRLDEYDGSPM